MTHPSFPGFKWYVKTNYQHINPNSVTEWFYFLVDLVPLYRRFKAMYQ